MLPARTWYHGRDEELPPRQELRAGPLTLLLERGDLLSLKLGDREIVRRIYVAVRDRNWGTVAPVLSDVRRELARDSFRVSFHADHRGGPIHFSWDALITGASDGTVTFAMEGQAHTTFLKNRIGFCILHPDVCAGARCRLARADGGTQASSFPAAISPHQPFRELRGIAHEVAPGTWAELSFEGDIFEMEDQRNWTDASFKTYCTPLRLPFPAEIRAGTRVAQSVTLRLQGVTEVGPGTGMTSGSVAAYELHPERPRRPLPALGLGLASHGAPLAEREVALLRALRLDHLRVNIDLSRPFQEALREATAEAAALRTRLEVALTLSSAAREELTALVAALPAACEVARWLVFHRDEPSTAARWVSLAREVLGPVRPGVPVAAGASAYFTELNRGPTPDFADEVVFSVNPQIHAFDSFSLVETLRMQGLTVENARRLSGGKPIVVSPVTLKPPFNAVATGPVVPPAPGELPDQVDVRQMSLFGAAWTLGSLASLASSGAASVTCYETTGWRGVMETAGGPPVPERFPDLRGCVFPLYHVLADLRELAGGVLVDGASAAPLLLEGLTVGSDRGLRTLVANMTPRPSTALIRGAGARGWVRFLDEASVEGACHEPGRFRSERGRLLTSRAGELRLELLPYATARIDWES